MQATVRTPVLETAYLETGPADGTPVILLHGFPDDPHCYDDVARPLATAGCRVLVPWLRGYGPTRFLDPATPRSGQQAALGADLRDFIDALELDRPLLAGYDWGGRAACIVAALWPERVRGLVSVNGYNIQNIAGANQPASAAQELRYWYQWYFHTERGRAGLTRYPARDLPDALATLVAELPLRGRHLRAHSRKLRQSGFRRCGDPILSPSLRQRPRRSGTGGNRATPRGSAIDRDPYDRAGWGSRRRASAITHR